MQLTARTDYIRNRLVDYMHSMGVVASPIAPTVWVGLNDLGPQSRFGLGRPVPFDDTNPIAVAFCAEIIAQVTEDLNDEDIELYLEALEFIVDLQVALFGDVTPIEALEQAENMLYECGPDSLRLYSTTQAAAIDRGL